jgi:cyclopropane-fatty-acyl-phospholipid synthase
MGANMAALKVAEKEEYVQLTLRLLDELFSSHSDQFTVRLWNGTTWPDDRPRQATLVLNHPGALRAMLLPGTEIALAEAYLYNDVDIEGDFLATFHWANDLAQKTSNWKQKLSFGRELMRLPNRMNPRVSRRGPAKLSGKRHSLERDRQAVAYHYNVSNDFYALFLGKRMVYTCAYFRNLEESLDQAQEQKLEHICRKLRLKPGQRLLDIGCGWGSLVLYAAEKYGVDATGVTLSQPQVDLANQRIAAARLQDRCRVQFRDYREVTEPYDVVASIGMFEQVGEDQLATYFQHVNRILRPGGVFLNHGIARRVVEKTWDPQNFSDAYVFPDGELSPISHTLRVAEECGFEVRDVESLREHYIQTLMRWVRNLETRHDEALAYVDEPTYRVWRAYMSASEFGFRSGRLNLYQSLLFKPAGFGPSNLPLTREDWYCS